MEEGRAGVALMATFLWEIPTRAAHRIKARGKQSRLLYTGVGECQQALTRVWRTSYLLNWVELSPCSVWDNASGMKVR